MATFSDEGRFSYYDYARKGQLFVAYATVTAPVIWSTATGTGGPLIWNNSSTKDRQVNVVLIAMGVGITVASAAASALGITGGTTTAPSATTAIDASANTYMGGPAPRANLYRIGTVSAAGTFFVPTYTLDTAALTAIPTTETWIDLHGAFVAPPGGFLAVAASATATTAQVAISLVFAEVPI